MVNSSCRSPSLVQLVRFAFVGASPRWAVRDSTDRTRVETFNRLQADRPIGNADRRVPDQHRRTHLSFPSLPPVPQRDVGRVPSPTKPSAAQSCSSSTKRAQPESMSSAQSALPPSLSRRVANPRPARYNRHPACRMATTRQSHRFSAVGTAAMTASGLWEIAPAGARIGCDMGVFLP